MDTVSPPLHKKTSVQKKIPSPLKLQQSPEPLIPERSLSKISSHDDLALKLEKCSIQSPLMEGYGCKDIRKSRTFEPFRRRYFVLYNEVLIYYQHKAQFEKDKKRGLVSCLFFKEPWHCSSVNHMNRSNYSVSNTSAIAMCSFVSSWILNMNWTPLTRPPDIIQNGLMNLMQNAHYQICRFCTSSWISIQKSIIKYALLSLVHEFDTLVHSSWIWYVVSPPEKCHSHNFGRCLSDQARGKAFHHG